MTGTSPKRIAILGMHLESNSFAPVTTEQDFRGLCHFSGEALLAEARSPNPGVPAEVPGFIRQMDALGPWTPVPVLVTAAEPGGPVDHTFFLDTLTAMRRMLEAALPVDAVFITNHGAMTSTGSTDPDGLMFRAIRRIVGAKVPIIATVDLHANISELMVESVDVLISYRTNPHVDQAERGAEAARVLGEMFGGMRPCAAFIRLPLVPPTINLLTAAGPYADLIQYGQSHSGPDIVNVSVVGGFPVGDTPKNGLSVIVTSRAGRAPAQHLAREIAERGWATRASFIKPLTSLEDATAMAVRAGEDPSQPARIFSDAADNPGGGGRGNTTWILDALHRAGARGVLLGIFYDPALAAEAHAAGEGATFHARFNRAEPNEYSRPFEAEARVLRLSDGACIGRRGMWAGWSLSLGPSAALQVGGITVIVVSMRKQCADPVFFEMFGLDIAAARTVVVKSRGHFRAGFDEFFTPDRVVEVDTPGLTSPVLQRFAFRNLPRPVFPLDPDTVWTIPDVA